MRRLDRTEAEVICLHCGWTRRVRGTTAIDAARAASALGIEHRRERHGRWRAVARGGRGSSEIETIRQGQTR